jgi:hypothetical protein
VAGKIVMMPNGLRGSWMLVARGMPGGILEMGLTEEATERKGRKLAEERGAEFVRVESWRDAPEGDEEGTEAP